MTRPVTAARTRRTAPLAVATAVAVAAFLVPAAPVGAQQLLPSASPERCGPAPAGTVSAAAWLDRAAALVLPPDGDARVLRFRAGHETPLWEQSDRMYEPFVPNVTASTRWVDLHAGLEGRAPIDRPPGPGMRPSQINSISTSYLARDTTVMRLPADSAGTNTAAAFNPWLVLAAWRADAANARVVGRCLYRDAWRIVLARGAEKLYLSESDAEPVKLDRTEPHYLWGQVHAEYLWSTWWGVNGGGYYPNAAFRLFDGTVYERAGILGFQTALVPRDSAPRLDVAGAVPFPAPPAGNAPDTIRVDADTWLLRTPAYTEAVTLRRDTVFLLDATTSEARARADSAWIAKLFPGRHPVVLVVTDLAWPHVSGVRFWVARGAIVASHRASESFLRRVVDRKWTLNPDALERARATARFRFRAVDDSLRLAGGDLVLHALRNTSTETAIGAWVGQSRFFWAGDYVQRDPTSPYSRDVAHTIRALGLVPLKVGAQHVPLTDWTAFEARFPLPRP
ncbi:MAG TPA: hypothetical protein VG916_13380 [Gemmatimonadaceae bacterium]|nr:hypothetical protein [Gemmatimonadaceae bacterium]